MKSHLYMLPVMRLSVLCVTSFLFSTGAAALSGNELLQDCRSEPGFKSGYCLGFIVGSGYGYSEGRQGGALYQYFGRSLKNLKEFQDRASEADAVSRSAAYYCIPSGVTQGQMLEVVTKYLEGNPALRHWDATLLVAAALKEAFPCP
jgi:hypothetical protein